MQVEARALTEAKALTDVKPVLDDSIDREREKEKGNATIKDRMKTKMFAVYSMPRIIDAISAISLHGRTSI